LIQWYLNGKLSGDAKALVEEYPELVERIELTRQARQARESIPWSQTYLQHKEVMQALGRWDKMKNDHVNIPDVFKKTSDIREERAVAMRRERLLRETVFDTSCQEFHDFYSGQLGYDFRTDWDQNKNREDIPWSEKYEQHKEAMVNKRRRVRVENENGNRPDVFHTGKDGIPEEKRAAKRRGTLLAKKDFDAACQEFHDLLEGFGIRFEDVLAEEQDKQEEQEKEERG